MRKYTTAFTLTETLSRVMTSCFGTLSTMTRRSTRRMRCSTGQMSTSPGPLMPVKRPTVKTTARSYSLSTLSAEKMRTAMMTTTAMTNGMQETPADRYCGSTHNVRPSTRTMRASSPACRALALRAFHSSPP